MSKHAFLSPSGSHRWLNCTPSAILESEFPGGRSSATDDFSTVTDDDFLS